MAKLKYTFKSDILFKMLFVKYPELLKRLVSALLSIPYESITEFTITNGEMPPEAIKKKFCRLDIAMVVNGQRVNLEIQVENEGNFPERALFHWARQYSLALPEKENYSALPRTVMIGIVHFKMSKGKDFHSEYEALEVKRHTRLSDKFSVHIYELPKLPKTVNSKSGMELWMALFKAKTEDDLAKIEKMEVEVMSEAIGAYRHISASPEYQEMERLRSKAGHDEAQALRNATLKERKKWERVFAAKEADLAAKDADLAAMNADLAAMNAALAEQAALIAELQAKLDKQ